MTKHELDTHIDTYGGEVKRRKRLSTTVAICAIAAALFAAYMLIMPGVTMEQKEAVCGKVEHTHDATCYTQTLKCELPEAQVHVHTPSCYNELNELTCTITPAVHMHLDQCYAVGGELICTDATPGHVHSATCFAKPGDLICVEEEFAHIHRASCYDANGVLTCKVTLPHVHGDTCYNEADVLVCTLPSAGHVHCDACWQHAGDLICTITETVATPVAAAPSAATPAATEAGADEARPAETAAVEVTTTEVVPATPGHVHGPECYASADTLICGQTEQVVITHKHDDSCYERVYTCTLEEHAHDEVCFDAETYQMIQATEENRAKLEAEDEAAAEEAAEEDFSLETEVTGDVIEAQDILYENESIIFTIEVPDKLKNRVKIQITEDELNATALSVSEGNTEIDNLELESISLEDKGNQDDVATEFADDDPEVDSQLQIASLVDDEPDTLFAGTFFVDVTLDGEPVPAEDISALGLRGKLQVKPSVVEPVLNELNSEDIAPELQGNVGARLTIVQTNDYVQNLSLSEQPEEQIDQVVLTDANQATVTFALATNEVTALSQATKNFEFEVQYYTYIPTIVLSDKENASQSASQNSVINTAGKGLPTNGTMLASNLSYLTFDYDQKSGAYTVKTEDILQPIYTTERFKYLSRPAMKYFNKLRTKAKHYKPKEAWILKDGKSPESTERSDWTIYTCYSSSYDNKEEEWKFTNNPSYKNQANTPYIYLEENTVVRFVYETTTDGYSGSASFYDYDITNGYLYASASDASNDRNRKNTQTYQDSMEANGAKNPVYAKTNKQGINQNSNYSGSGYAKYAFGNANTNTTLGNQIYNGNAINRYNGADYGNSQRGCSFGLVKGFDDKTNQLIFSDGIDAPNIFGGDAQGKTPFSGSLGFRRVGDTFTLTSAALNGTQGVSGLDTFNHPKCGTKNTYNHIWTNDFWPMDEAKTYGANYHDLKFGAAKYFTGNYVSKNDSRRNQAYNSNNSDDNSGGFPPSDDGKDHNSYFGMYYEINFSIAKDYIGPLDYLFYGDDDLWVFVDDKLVADLGGVHSSVGEYVDLWDYLPKDDSDTYKEHKLRVYYTERGASGSTCYMHFTLPQVSFQSTGIETTNLTIAKQVDEAGATAADIDKEDFLFNISMNTNEDASLQYDYAIYRKGSNELLNTGAIGTTDFFYLKHNELIKIFDLPVGTTFEVIEELNEEQAPLYQTTSSVTNKPGETFEKSISGQVSNEAIQVDFLNTRIYELPATGGIGTVWFFVGGAILISVGVVMFMRKPREVS